MCKKLSLSISIFKKTKTIINKENLTLIYYNYIILIFKNIGGNTCFY